MNEEKCDTCFKKNTLVIKPHEGTQVCTSCGMVQQVNMIDQTNEKRYFSSDVHGADTH